MSSVASSSEPAEGLSRPEAWTSTSGPALMFSPAKGNVPSKAISPALGLESPSPPHLPRDGVFMVGCRRVLQDPGLSVARSRGRIRADRHRRTDAVDARAGDAHRDPARLRPHDRHCDSARPPDCPIPVGQADRLSTDHAHAAGAQDRRGSAVPRLARLRHRVQGSAHVAHDVPSAAPREHQRLS